MQQAEGVFEGNGEIILKQEIKEEEERNQEYYWNTSASLAS